MLESGINRVESLTDGLLRQPFSPMTLALSALIFRCQRAVVLSLFSSLPSLSLRVRLWCFVPGEQMIIRAHLNELPVLKDVQGNGRCPFGPSHGVWFVMSVASPIICFSLVLVCSVNLFSLVSLGMPNVPTSVRGQGSRGVSIGCPSDLFSKSGDLRVLCSQGLIIGGRLSLRTLCDNGWRCKKP